MQSAAFITFPHQYSNPEDEAEGINLEKPEESINELVDPNTTVITQSDIKIKYDFPLANPIIFSYHSDFGFNRADLARIISEEYHKLYDTENEFIDNQNLPEDVDVQGLYGIDWDVSLVSLTLISVRYLGNDLYELEIEQS